jgi:hypothetical protein
MRGDLAFRLSFYLTLGFACVTLGLAEQPFLNDALAWVIPMPILLATAFFLEGRWSLSIRAANVLGGVIFVGMLAWIVSRLRSDDPILAQAPMPAALLPYLGPLLMVLMAAKLLRPKHVGDYWGLYAIGLMQVALGCVLAMDLLFGTLLIVYVGCLLWSLSCFHSWRERTAAAAVRMPAPDAGPRRRRLALLLSVGDGAVWLAVVAGVGFVLFLCTPRTAQTQWSPLSLQPTGKGGTLQTGIGDGVDLNRTGRLEVTNEVVCELTAENADGSPKTDLPDSQRWRSKVLDYYRSGRWQPHFPQGIAGMPREGVDLRAAAPGAAASGGPVGGGTPGLGTTAALPEIEQTGMRQPGVARVGMPSPAQVDAEADARRQRVRPATPSTRPASGANPAVEATPANRETRAGVAIVGIGMNAGPPINLPRASFRLPDYGQAEIILTFEVYPEKAGGLMLADPVTLHPRVPSATQEALRGLAALGRAEVSSLGNALSGMAQAFLGAGGLSERPVVTLRDRSLAPALFGESYGTLVPVDQRLNRDKERYQQAFLPPEERDLSSAIPVRGDLLAGYFRIIRQDEGIVDDLREWTDQLLVRLQTLPTYALSAKDIEKTGSPKSLRETSWEKVGRTLTNFLASSGEFTYSTELRRRDRNIDPTLDFLKNVKQGHCSRYAAALALMLRSQGVPARVVMGYRGCDAKEDSPGVYVIRQSHAHSWVEIPVQRPGPNGATAWHWLSLDPTPSNDSATTAQFSWAHLWESLKRVTQDTWKYFIVDYNAEQQYGLTQDVADSFRFSGSLSGLLGSSAFWLSWRPWVILLPLAFISYRVTRRVRRFTRRRTAAPGRRPIIAFQARLLLLLERHCRLRPQPSQTAWEFATAAEPRLTSIVGDLGVLPRQITDVFYRVRFGGRPLSPEESQTLDRQLDEFDAALARHATAAG